MAEKEMTPEDGAERLIPLLVQIGELRDRGISSDKLDEKVRDIGRSLSVGGFLAKMSQACDLVEDHNVDLAIRLDYIWDGIGTWAA